MNIFPRKAKSTAGAYYFGEFDDMPLAPFSISIATLDESYKGEKKHYHTQNQKVYLTLEGEGILAVDGKEVLLKPDLLVHVEPSEVHFIAKVTKSPLKIIVINSSKINDKVVMEE